MRNFPLFVYLLMAVARPLDKILFQDTDQHGKHGAFSLNSVYKESQSGLWNSHVYLPFASCGVVQTMG